MRQSPFTPVPYDFVGMTHSRGTRQEREPTEEESILPEPSLTLNEGQLYVPTDEFHRSAQRRFIVLEQQNNLRLQYARQLAQGVQPDPRLLTSTGRGMKCVALISGGKDSWFNAMHCVANGHEIVALANLHPAPTRPGIIPYSLFRLIEDELDSFMYQTVGHDAIHLQAECYPVPLYREVISGESLDQSLNYTTTEKDETEDLFRLLSRVKEAQPDIQGVSVGAILSNYQRTRVENVCARLGLTPLAYLWQRDQKEILADIIASGLVAVIIKVAAVGTLLLFLAYVGLKSVHLGKPLSDMQSTLLALVLHGHATLM